MATIYDPAPNSQQLGSMPYDSNGYNTFNPGGGGGGGGIGMGQSLQPYISGVSSPAGMGGMNNGLAQNLIQSMTQQGNQARMDSLKQYKNLLASVAGTRSNVEGMFGQLGQSGMDQINMNNQQQMGQATQSAFGRGLGNTTILDSLKGGVNFNTQMAKNNLNTSLAGQKANMEMGLGQMQGDAILSRNNQGPDMGMMLQLLQSLGSTGGGTGGSGQLMSGR